MIMNGYTLLHVVSVNQLSYQAPAPQLSEGGEHEDDHWHGRHETCELRGL